MPARYIPTELGLLSELGSGFAQFLGGRAVRIGMHLPQDRADGRILVVACALVGIHLTSLMVTIANPSFGSAILANAWLDKSTTLSGNIFLSGP